MGFRRSPSCREVPLTAREKALAVRGLRKDPSALDDSDKYRYQRQEQQDMDEASQGVGS
jgi:hypothetical protein